MGGLPWGGTVLNGANMRLDFYFKEWVVGYFLGLTDYPIVPGKYTYMPYRGYGSLQFYLECQRNGLAQCTYKAQNGKVSFIVKIGANKGEIQIDEFLKENG
jgi:hypothetical protein